MKLLAAYSIAALLAIAVACDMLQGQEGKKADLPVSILKERAFPFYSIFMTSARWIYGYFNAADPIHVKVAWWGAFIAGDGGLIDTATDIENACKSCMARHKDPPGGSCEDDVKTAIKSVVLNLIIGFVGWYSSRSISFIRGLSSQKRKVLIQLSRFWIELHLPFTLMDLQGFIEYADTSVDICQFG
ncbi:hypothetical protein NCAS_0G00110 [Naumovozyma castellii]|uniref:Uncharacterized protein n=1 Tax=Naumovozyma castellii TaxID=27288 RepID=G0VHL4_NAUCA|nr:hypothetical protein NCAS_0G00110 [Naumovozyma castellii CBS 4309]CCC70898.1 hypothetical protein NCAS_0G00110 [Naumovozyma castellii CBS 4309]